MKKFKFKIQSQKIVVYDYTIVFFFITSKSVINFFKNVLYHY